MFLSVPPSYQYLHSPFINHISPIHHSTLTFLPFTHSHFTTHHSLILPLFFWSSSEKHPFIRRAPEGLSNNIRRKVETRWTNLVKGGQNWSNVVKRGQTWTNVDKGGQNWSNMDKHGQRWSNVEKSGQRWSNMDKRGQVWTKVVKSGQTWSNVDKRGQIWSELVK